MNPLFLMLVAAAGLLVAPVVKAAPLRTTPGHGRPTLSLQLKSVAELMATAKTAAKNFLPDEIYKE